MTTCSADDVLLCWLLSVWFLQISSLCKKLWSSSIPLADVIPPGGCDEQGRIYTNVYIPIIRMYTSIPIYIYLLLMQSLLEDMMSKVEYWSPCTESCCCRGHKQDLMTKYHNNTITKKYSFIFGESASLKPFLAHKTCSEQFWSQS